MQVSTERIGAFCPQSLSLLLWSLGKVGYSPGRVWARTQLGRSAWWVWGFEWDDLEQQNGMEQNGNGMVCLVGLGLGLGMNACECTLLSFCPYTPNPRLCPCH